MRPVVLIILDGWGVAPAGPGNAIALAKLPFHQRLLSFFPHSLLEASGEAVGLPKGEDGNSETGHMNLGAGFIVHQDLPRINLSIADGSFFKNSAFLNAIDHARKYESNIHLLGLIGSGGVHSNTEHLLALLQLLKEQEYLKVFLHLITDGRDSPPKSAKLYVKEIENHLETLKFGSIASIMGRYYAMDRDRRWSRTQKTYETLTQGTGEKTKSALEAIASSYEQNITDEFIKPTNIVKEDKPISLISPNDSVIFFNYRIDRPRQLTKAFVLEDFKRDADRMDFDPFADKYYKKHFPEMSSGEALFKRGARLTHLYFVTMTEYSRDVHASAVAFPPQIIAHPLGECISQQGLLQLRVSESEKERFVTYYFNGQKEAPFVGESKLIIPSPKVPTYDLKPEMSAFELTDILIDNLKRKKHDFFVVNFANPDMVAHTGNLHAAIRACEVVDECLSKIIPTVLSLRGTVFVTADHGNVEELINPKTGDIDTEHSGNPVPFIAINKKWEGKTQELSTGVLADVAPTILEFMHVKKSKTMTGRNLLENIVD